MPCSGTLVAYATLAGSSLLRWGVLPLNLLALVLCKDHTGTNKQQKEQQ
jgi:hypothetical protein